MSEESKGFWASLLDWADGVIHPDLAHDPAYIASHVGDEGYFRYHGDDDEEPDDDYEADGADYDDPGTSGE